jgi:hypothetical protein
MANMGEIRTKARLLFLATDSVLSQMNDRKDTVGPLLLEDVGALFELTAELLDCTNPKEDK